MNSCFHFFNVLLENCVCEKSEGRREEGRRKDEEGNP